MSQYWGGDYSHERGKVKRELILRWLAYFDYSDAKLLSDMLGVKYQGQGAYFARLVKDGVLVAISVPAIRSRIYALGRVGVEQAKIILSDLRITKPRLTPSWSTLAHLFAIQAAINHRKESLDSFSPEKHISGQFYTKHIPDALLVFGDKKVALEIELSHKSTDRIYHIFLSHIKNIQKGSYSEVLYLFNDGRLCELYQNKYNQSEWPIYRRDEAKRKLVLEDRTFSAQDHPDSLFEFKVESLYAL